MDLHSNDSEDSVELTSENISAALDSLANQYLPPRNTQNSVNGAGIGKPHHNFPITDNAPITVNAPITDKAYLSIVEEPQSRGFRFRYKCEGPSHGGLQGVNSVKGKKTYPTVQIMNYEGPAKIVVNLVTDDSSPKTHAHELVGKSCDKGICLVDVREAKNPTFSFQNVGVMHVTKRKVADVLRERISESMILNKRISSGNVNDQNITLNELEKQKAKEQADSQAKTMHLNVVRLCFQAYIQDENGNLTITLPPVISNPIYDSKSPGAAALKICRIDKCGGCCIGNEEVFLLCEKVQKDDIKVVFMETDQGTGWRREADFGPTDVHKQFAIVFKTPQYRNINITDPVKVLIKLERPSDGQCSEPKVFTYHPQNRDEDDIDRKRRKVIPGMPENDRFRNLLSTAPSDSPHYSGMNDPPFQFYNGGSDNMNYGCQNVFSSEEVGDTGLYFTPEPSYPVPQFNFVQEPPMNFDVVDGDASHDDLEVDSVPCDSTSLKPYQPVIFQDDTKNTFKERKDMKLEEMKLYKIEDDLTSFKNPEDDLKKDFKDQKSYKIEYDQKSFKNPKDDLKKDFKDWKSYKIETDQKSFKNPKDEFKKVESCKVMEKLPSEVKTEYPSPEKKPSVEKNPFHKDLLLPFRTFCATGNIEDLLMQNRSLMLIPDENGDNCLHLAILNKQSYVVHNLLPVIAACPKDVNISNHRYQTGLHLAVLTNQPDMVELLLNYGIKRTLVDCNGNTAVHLAVKYNYIKCLKSLLKLDPRNDTTSDPFPELDMLNYDGYSPLHLACLKSSMESVKILVDSKAEVNLPDGKSGRTPLHIAVEKNDLLLAGELLLEAECETDCVTYDGNTPLHIACGREYDAIVALLLSLGANPEATSGMSDWCLSDDSDFESSAEEDQSLDDMRGTRPRDLVFNNPKILHLLDGDRYESSISGSEVSEDVKDFSYGDLNQLSDQMRMTLADLIDSAEENWKSLAKLLQLEYLIDEVKSTGSPTMSILDMYEMLGGQLKDLYSATKKLEMDDAACLLNEIMR